MKIQLSFELLVYFALAGIAILSAVAFLVSKWPAINGAINEYSVSSFVSSVNEAVSSGAASFGAYVPYGMCNSTVSGDEIRTNYGTFYLMGSVDFSGNSLCPDGEYADMQIAYGSGDSVVIAR